MAANSYYSGSLPRLSQQQQQQLNQQRASKESSCRSLARASSVRAWAQLDSVSVAPQRLSQHQHSNRNKFNTLTPAEAQAHAKRLRAGLRTPSRTASVLHKPRAPPMLAPTTDQRPQCSPSPRDLPDCAPPSALQSMSVDLGDPARSIASSSSYSSPRSLAGFSKLRNIEHQQSSQCLKQRQASRNSLSSSTSKVIQNFKRLFQRQAPAPAPSPTPSNADALSYSSFHTSLNESVSQICLNRSHSPATICQPLPPSCDLKSMSYLEGNATLSQSVNYSNYDDFTRLRNEQTSNLLHQSRPASNHHPDDLYSNLSHIDDDSNSWQLTSLPIAYERNLTTVFEEQANQAGLQRRALKPNPPDPPVNFRSMTSTNHIGTEDESNRRISSPSQSLSSVATIDSVLDSSVSNKQTLNSKRTSFRFSYTQPIVYDEVRSVDDHQQLLPECPPMCSHSNLSCPLLIHSQKNSGLPPRFPSNGEPKHNYNSSGGSSRNSSVTNSNNSGSGSSSNGEQVSPGAISSVSSDKASICTAEDLILDQKLTGSQYCSPRCLDDDITIDGDTTIISDTSTIRGDSVDNSSAAVYQDRCAQLERTVESLKNKIISKEKELTDMQLKLWSSDYQTDQLKATISRLEKENAQLKSLMPSRNGATASRTTLKG